MAAPAHTVEEREELFLPLENFVLQEKDLEGALSIVTEDDRMRIDRAPHYDIAKGKIVRGFHFEPAKKKRTGHGNEMKD